MAIIDSDTSWVENYLRYIKLKDNIKDTIDSQIKNAEIAANKANDAVNEFGKLKNDLSSEIKKIETVTNNANNTITDLNKLKADLQPLDGLSVEDDSSTYADIDVYNTVEVDMLINNINDRLKKLENK